MIDKLEDSEEVLLRQIHPTFFENGEPSSDRFRPSQLDKNLLSLDRNSMVSPAQSHANYEGAGRKSAAVFGVTVGEFMIENIDCLHDPLDSTPVQAANPAHASANYERHDLKQQKLIAKRLKRVAIARGCLHLAGD
jgi:hypothetical protein